MVACRGGGRVAPDSKEGCVMYLEFLALRQPRQFSHISDPALTDARSLEAP